MRQIANKAETKSKLGSFVQIQPFVFSSLRCCSAHKALVLREHCADQDPHSITEPAFRCLLPLLRAEPVVGEEPAEEPEPALSPVAAAADATEAPGADPSADAAASTAPAVLDDEPDDDADAPPEAAPEAAPTEAEGGGDGELDALRRRNAELEAELAAVKGKLEAREAEVERLKDVLQQQVDLPECSLLRLSSDDEFTALGSHRLNPPNCLHTTTTHSVGGLGSRGDHANDPYAGNDNVTPWGNTGGRRRRAGPAAGPADEAQEGAGGGRRGARRLMGGAQALRAGGRAPGRARLLNCCIAGPRAWRVPRVRRCSALCSGELVQPLSPGMPPLYNGWQGCLYRYVAPSTSALDRALPCVFCRRASSLL